jgi:hypothetical protein
VGKTPQISMVHPDIRAAASVSVEISMELAIGQMITRYALSMLVPNLNCILREISGSKSRWQKYGEAVEWAPFLVSSHHFIFAP